MLYVELDGAGTARTSTTRHTSTTAPSPPGEPAVDAILRLARSAPGSHGKSSNAPSATPSETVVPEHLAEVRDRNVALIDKTEAAVKDRLTKEIS